MTRFDNSLQSKPRGRGPFITPGCDADLTGTSLRRGVSNCRTGGGWKLSNSGPGTAAFFASSLLH